MSPTASSTTWTIAPTTITANAAMTHARYSRRVRASPSRTASVRFPLAASVGMSRRLFATRIATASSPSAVPAHHASAVTVSTITKVVPHVATSPKNTNTITSPSPRPAYGRGPPL